MLRTCWRNARCAAHAVGRKLKLELLQISDLLGTKEVDIARRSRDLEPPLPQWQEMESRRMLARLRDLTGGAVFAQNSERSRNFGDFRGIAIPCSA
jgi:hypothetical protein